MIPSRSRILLSIWIVVVAAAVLVPIAANRAPRIAVPATPVQIRQVLFRELQPVKLSNCTLERFGEAHDGGYLLCGNLLGAVASGYSYGISGYDGWGCDISRKLDVTVHQYDCFDLTRPVCDGGATVFHGECIGVAAGLEDGRPFDTLESQIVKNGDRGKRLVVKMDVEGAEWDSFLDAPNDVLQRIDQLAVEFHGSGDARYLEAVQRLKQFFHVVHLHWNNYACVESQDPFRAWAYEVLFVNKRIGVVDPAGKVVLPHPLDAPNNPGKPDCRGARSSRLAGLAPRLFLTGS